MRRGLRKHPFAGLMVLLGTLSLLLAACGGSTTSSGNQAPDSKQIFHNVITGVSDIKGMDPALQTDLNSVSVIEMVWPNLVALNSKLEVTPWASTAAPQVSADGLTYTFKIRPGLSFTDGEPIDASAFAYSINRAEDPCTASPAAYYLYVLKDATTFNGETCNKDGTYSAATGQTSPVVKTLIGDSLIVQDAQTLVMNLQQPAAYFLEALSYPTADAVPQNLVKQYGAKWIDHLADNGGMGGNLYKVTKWDHTGSLVLERNDKFWGTKPKLREIDFTIYKAVDTAYNAFRSGQGDIGFAPTSQYAAAKTKPGFHEVGQLWTDYYAMNWKDAPFDDVRVRQAFDLALDKQAIATDVLHGTVSPTNHIVPQGMPGYDTSLNGPDGTPSVSGNAQKATQLATAYATEKCGGQMSKCPQVTLTISSGSQDTQNEAEAALQMWNKAMPGWPIKIATTDFNTLLNDLNAKTLQFWAIDWIADYPDPQDWLSLQFLPNSAYNSSNVSVPDANALMQKADKEQDQTQRMQDYNAAEQLLVTNVAWLPIDQVKTWWEIRPYVNNFSVDAGGLTTLDTWQSIYISNH